MRLVDRFKKWFAWEYIASPIDCPKTDLRLDDCKASSKVPLVKPTRIGVAAWQKLKAKRESELADVKDQLKMIKMDIVNQRKPKKFRLHPINGSIIHRRRKGFKVGQIGLEVKKFLRCCCKYEKNAVTSMQDLYQTYLEWCKNKHIKQATFIGMPRFLDPKKVTAIQIRTNGKDFRCFRGVKIT
jgi:hypothetical protein